LFSPRSITSTSGANSESRSLPVEIAISRADKSGQMGVDDLAASVTLSVGEALAAPTCGRDRSLSELFTLTFIFLQISTKAALRLAGLSESRGRPGSCAA